MRRPKLGKKPARSGAVKFKLSKYLDIPALPTPPDQFGHETAVKYFQMLGNDHVGDCLAPDSRVLMADGTTKAIQEVRVLDEVMTPSAKVCPVLAVRAKEWNDDLIAVKLYGNNLLHVTRDHKVFTKRGWVRAGNLRLTDWMYQPRVGCADRCDAVSPRTYVTRWEGMKKIGRSRVRKIHGETVITLLPETIKLTPKFGRLIGLFLAEGSTNQNVTRWTFGHDEDNTLVAECVSLLQGLGANPKTLKRCNGSITVTVCGKHWRIVFEKLCCHGAAEKHMHPSILAGPSDFLASVLTGWMDGDGHSRRGEQQGTTVSHALALDMVQIGLRLGRSPVIRKEHRTPNPPIKSCLPRYEIVFRENEKQGSGFVERAELGVWRRIRSLDAKPFSGHVFDLTVEDEHSFVAESIAVHNCVLAGAAHETMIWTAQTGNQALFDDNAVISDYSAITGYTPSDPNTDSGTDMQAAAEYRRTTGVVDSVGNRHKVMAYLAINHSDLNELAVAMYLFDVVGLGIQFPSSAMEQFNEEKPWVPVAGDTIEGGHYVPLCARRGGMFYCVTWGQLQQMSPEFITSYADEAVVYLSTENLVGGRTLEGFDLNQLQADLAQLK